MFDVNNALLDNDRIIADLEALLLSECGSGRSKYYWAHFESICAELSYANYLGALRRQRLSTNYDPKLLLLSSFLTDCPFSDRLFCGSLDVIRHLRRWGQTVILLDDDVVLQPHKVRRFGLWDAVEGRVLIYIHKEKMLAGIERRFHVMHYVTVDDKLRILAEMKISCRQHLTTIYPRQGHYTLDAYNLTAYPPIDLIHRTDQCAHEV